MACRPWPQKIPASDQATRTSNPIRKIVDHRRPPKDPSKKLISLDIGDPTIYGNMSTDELVTKAVVRNVEDGHANGYAPSSGSVAARAAVAAYVDDPIRPLTVDDVIIASGCSGALELCISALANPGDNILLPRPGFSLYRTIASSKDIEHKEYRLVPERSWEIDLDHLESLIDDRTKAILVNNPSNPCGSVYSAQHIRDILKVAERNAIPVIADEIYAHMVFDEEATPFVSVASQSETVPVLSVGGIAKRFVVPGWRVGWVTVHDRLGRLEAVSAGLKNLTTLILGACTLIQSILPDILANVPKDFFQQTMALLRTNSECLEKGLDSIDGLQSVKAQGAMYLMVHIDVSRFKDIENDVQFFSLLLEEESVSVLPGQIFGADNYFRLVTCASVEVIDVAVERIRVFCQRHYKE